MTTRVFLAEDHDDLAALIERKLATRDWRVERARTSAEASARLRGDRFDVVVLDYKLPDGDGLELLGVVRENSPQTPVLFLTAHGSEGVALRALGLGASDYMQKSVTMLDELPSRIDALLAREGEVREASRVVAVEAPPEPKPRALGVDPGVAERLLAEFVHGDVLGAALFDGAGMPIAAILPPPLDPSVLGATLLQVHAQVGLLGRLNRVSPRAYTFLVETDAGTLACTTVGGRAVVAVLVRAGARASERLDALAARVR